MAKFFRVVSRNRELLLSEILHFRDREIIFYLRNVCFFFFSKFVLVRTNWIWFWTTALRYRDPTNFLTILAFYPLPANSHQLVRDLNLECEGSRRESLRSRIVFRPRWFGWQADSCLDPGLHSSSMRYTISREKIKRKPRGRILDEFLSSPWNFDRIRVSFKCFRLAVLSFVKNRRRHGFIRSDGFKRNESS